MTLWGSGRVSPHLLISISVPSIYLFSLSLCLPSSANLDRSADVHTLCLWLSTLLYSTHFPVLQLNSWIVSSLPAVTKNSPLSSKDKLVISVFFWTCSVKTLAGLKVESNLLVNPTLSAATLELEAIEWSVDCWCWEDKIPNDFWLCNIPSSNFNPIQFYSNDAQIEKQSQSLESVVTRIQNQQQESYSNDFNKQLDSSQQVRQTFSTSSAPKGTKGIRKVVKGESKWVKYSRVQQTTHPTLSQHSSLSVSSNLDKQFSSYSFLVLPLALSLTDLSPFTQNSKNDPEAGELHPDARRKPTPDFEGETNPSTGEVGGPKKDPLSWQREWTYGGRATDF